MSASSPIQQLLVAERDHVDVTADRFGCGASSIADRRKCALYLWLLGPTTTQLTVACPCRS